MTNFRSQMPVTRQWAYFDHAAVAPLPAPAQAAMAQWSDDVASNGLVNWSRWRGNAERARELAASLIKAQSDEVAHVHSTTEGISLIAEGIQWKPDDNVVVPDCEFPSNLYPWLNLRDRGVEVRIVPTEQRRCRVEQLQAACDQHTRLIAVSWVQYASGWRIDVDRLAEWTQSRGILLFMDAIQALGVQPLDVKDTPIDFFAADSHKWLLGPEGAGLLYIRKERLSELRPLLVGWNSVAHAGDFDDHRPEWKEAAGRYEGGTYNMGGIAGMMASLKMLTDFGVANAAQTIHDTCELICDRVRSIGGEILSDRSAEHASSIVICRLPDRDPEALRKHCAGSGVIVSNRGGGLRISPHAYNDETDVDRLIDALESARD